MKTLESITETIQNVTKGTFSNTQRSGTAYSQSLSEFFVRKNIIPHNQKALPDVFIVCKQWFSKILVEIQTVKISRSLKN